MLPVGNSNSTPRFVARKCHPPPPFGLHVAASRKPRIGSPGTKRAAVALFPVSDTRIPRSHAAMKGVLAWLIGIPIPIIIILYLMHVF